GQRESNGKAEKSALHCERVPFEHRRFNRGERAGERRRIGRFAPIKRTSGNDLTDLREALEAVLKGMNHEPGTRNRGEGESRKSITPARFCRKTKPALH